MHSITLILRWDSRSDSTGERSGVTTTRSVKSCVLFETKCYSIATEKLLVTWSDPIEPRTSWYAGEQAPHLTHTRHTAVNNNTTSSTVLNGRPWPPHRHQSPPRHLRAKTGSEHKERRQDMQGSHFAPRRMALCAPQWPPHKGPHRFVSLIIG